MLLTRGSTFASRWRSPSGSSNPRSGLLPSPRPWTVRPRSPGGARSRPRDHEPDLAPVGAPSTLAQPATGPQPAGQRPAQAAAPVQESLVDRLVAHMPRRSVGVGQAQVRGDLLRSSTRASACPGRPARARRQRTADCLGGAGSGHDHGREPGPRRTGRHRGGAGCGPAPAYRRGRPVQTQRDLPPPGPEGPEGPAASRSAGTRRPS